MILTIIIAVAIFFFRFFWPVPQLLVTPDFGSSDAWHASFAMKYSLWEALQEGHLPLWNTYIGDGFPLFAEGQVGALYLPNLLFFRLPDPVIAYNLTLATAVLMCGIGMYFFLRVFKFSALTSVLGGLTFAISGPVIAHVPHITLLQGMSLFPVLFGLTHLLLTRGPWPWIPLWAAVASQQIFTGFPQGVLITILTTGVYILWQTIRTQNIRILLYFLTSVALTLGAGAAQLFPSYEFLKASEFASGFSSSLSSYFSFPLKHLITFLLPFALGNPKLATYPHFILFDGSVFWENIAYIGIIPLFLALVSIVVGRKNSIVQFFLFLSLGSLMLAWGAHSPLYFLYAMWPMTLFRVPSRFVWVTVAGLIFLATYAINYFRQKMRTRSYTFIILLLCVIQAAQLLNTWWTYHLLVPAHAWTAPPVSVASINNGRMYTVGAIQVYSRIYNQQGWQNAAPYRFLELGVIADSNILWEVSQHGVKAGRYLKRSSLVDDLLTQEIRIDQTQATISAIAQELLNRFSVTTVASFFPLTQQGLTKNADFSDQGLTLTTYTNPYALPRAYLTDEATVAATLRQAMYVLSQTNRPARQILLEQHDVDTTTDLAAFLNPTKLRNAPNDYGILSISEDSHTTVQIDVKQIPQQSVLVLTDTYYPGWHAYIDGQKTTIFAANLSQRAIIVPPGDHAIYFRYEPQSVRQGTKISIFFYSIITLLVVGPFVASFARRVYSVHQPDRGRPRNRDR